MNAESWKISDLQFKNRLLQERLEALETGEVFVRMQKEHRAELAYQDRIIKDLHHQIVEYKAQNTENRKHWEEVYDDVVQGCACEIEEMKKKVELAEAEKEKAYQERDMYREKAQKLKEELYAVRTQLEKEQDKSKMLNARLNKNYTNSSKPSSASPNHGKIHNGRVKTGKKPGAQKGHEHHSRKFRSPDKIVQIPPFEAYNCAILFRPTGRIIKKQVVSISVVTTVTQYETPEYMDLLTGKPVHAHFPEGCVDDVNYDTSVKAMAYMLNTACNVSIGKTQNFMREISGGAIDLSAGMICNLSREFSRKSENERQEIFNKHLAADVLHADFSFARKNGKQTAVMITATEDSVLYQARPKKGHEGVKNTPLEHFMNTLVSDHEAALVCHGSRHQECMVHVARYLIGASELEPNLSWHTRMHDWNSRAIAHSKSYSPENDSDWHRRSENLIDEFTSILKTAEKEYTDEPPNPYFPDGYNLFRRMDEKPDDYVLFLKDPSVPPNNSRCERLARIYKRKAIQMMSFRGELGDTYLCDGLTMIESFKSRGHNIFESIKSIFQKPLPKPI